MPRPCFGWELHKTSPGSDKYYRILLIDNVVLLNYGRRATKGQFMVHVFSAARGAQDKARVLTNEKVAEGYRTTRELTGFEVPDAEIASLMELSPGARRVDGDTAIWLIGRFKYASSVQQTEFEGASA